MKITIKKTIEETVEIDLPLFYKFKDDYQQKWIGAINEETVISFSTSKNYRDITNCNLWIKNTDVVNAFNNWEKIGEEEFLQAHADFLKSLSLVPVLETIDDLEGVLLMPGEAGSGLGDN